MVAIQIRNIDFFNKGMGLFSYPTCMKLKCSLIGIENDGVVRHKVNQLITLQHPEFPLYYYDKEIKISDTPVINVDFDLTVPFNSGSEYNYSNAIERLEKIAPLECFDFFITVDKIKKKIEEIEEKEATLLL